MYILSDLVPLYNVPEELWKMLQELDIITLNHSVRVCEICRIVEKELGYTNTNLSEAGLFHDIGKYFISTRLLNKRGKLNTIERVIIDSHSYYSYKTLSYFGLKNEVCYLSLYHHKLNPITYIDDKISEPDDEELKTKARVLKTIDIYEALTTDRPYHRGISPDKAREIIEDIGDYDITTLQILMRQHANFE